RQLFRGIFFVIATVTLLRNAGVYRKQAGSEAGSFCGLGFQQNAEKRKPITTGDTEDRSVPPVLPCGEKLFGESSTGPVLLAQASAQAFERLDDLPAPLPNFVFPQVAVVGLKNGPQKDRVLARRHIAATKNFGRSEAAQFTELQFVDSPLDLLKLRRVREHEREVSLHSRV